jgi:hypothetical protein
MIPMRQPQLQDLLSGTANVQIWPSKQHPPNVTDYLHYTVWCLEQGTGET